MTKPLSEQILSEQLKFTSSRVIGGSVVRIIPIDLFSTIFNQLKELEDAPVVEVIDDDANSLDRPVSWTPTLIPTSDLFAAGVRVALVRIPK